MQKKIIIANWKMNPLSRKEAEKLFSVIAREVGRMKKTDIIICPPAIYLGNLTKIRTNRLSLGAQDAFPGNTGAFTGEISAEMLYDLGARYTILGHSERQASGEVNTLINKKIKSALVSGLRPIVCVGERSRDDNHEYFNFVKNQLEECLAGVSRNSIAKVIIAYEPIWALSTTLDRRDATSRDSLEMSIFIRKILSDKFGKDATVTKILYGGSVNEKDAADFLTEGGVDGLLVGRASLDAKKFIKIIDICEALNK